jgi:transcriptional regulator with XRE-family HTH domain
VTEDPWKQQVEAFGQFIRTQRKLAKLTLRELGAQTDVSNAYLSQLERGLHAPSIRILKSLADAFDVSFETMLGQAGLLDEDEDEEPHGVEEAIKIDATLTREQKEALLAVYRGFTS